MKRENDDFCLKRADKSMEMLKGNGLRVAKVIENERGYYPLGKQNPNDPHELDKWFSYDADHIVKLVKSMNENMGHTQQDVMTCFLFSKVTIRE